MNRHWILIAVYIGILFPATAETTLGQEFSPHVTQLLGQKVSVRLDHETIGRVHEQFRHYGAPAFVPRPLADSGDLSLRSRSITIREIYEQVAASAGAEIRELDGSILFSKPLPDRAFNEMKRALRGSDVAASQQAIEKLCESSDLRIYAELFWAMAHGNPKVGRRAFDEIFARSTSVSGTRIALSHLPDYTDAVSGFSRVDKELLTEPQRSRPNLSLPVASLPFELHQEFKNLHPNGAAYFVEPRVSAKNSFDQLKRSLKTAVPLPSPNGNCPVGNPPPPINRAEIVQAMLQADRGPTAEFLTSEAKRLMKEKSFDTWHLTVAMGLMECNPVVFESFVRFCYEQEATTTDRKKEKYFGPTRPAFFRVVDAIQLTGDPKYVDSALLFINDPRSMIRRKAISALHVFRSEKSVAPLMKLMEQCFEESYTEPSKVDLISSILGALAQIDHPKTKEFFQARLNDHPLQKFAIYYLALTGDPTVDKRLPELLSDSELEPDVLRLMQFEQNPLDVVSWERTFNEFALEELSKMGNSTANQILEMRLQKELAVRPFDEWKHHSNSRFQSDQKYLDYTDSVSIAVTNFRNAKDAKARAAAIRSLYFTGITGSLRQRQKLYSDEDWALIKGAVGDESFRVRRIAERLVGVSR